MYSHYFKDWNVRPEFEKEFVSLWSGWLGKENYHKLDEVTEDDWFKFNSLIKLIFKKYRMELVDCELKSTSAIDDIEETLCTYQEAMNKDGDKFTKYIIPELGCVFSEEWDYTYIIWHTNNNEVEALLPFIKEVGLFNFSD